MCYSQVNCIYRNIIWNEKCFAEHYVLTTKNDILGPLLEELQYIKIINNLNCLRVFNLFIIYLTKLLTTQQNLINCFRNFKYFIFI